MSLAYSAAEFFIEAIGLSPNLSITNDFVKFLRSCASEEIAAYINKAGKGDHFFIFKKFRDVFVIKKGLINLTDAFLSIYALKRSISPKAVSLTPGIKDYSEKAAVLFCTTIISCHGPQNYIDLFNSLCNNSNQILAAHFHGYSIANAYNFFLSHADVFVTRNNFVFLNIHSRVRASQPNSPDSPEAVMELTDSVYFLLTCFESLHYIELKQCVSYVTKNAKDLLDKYPLIRQRELFEKLPETKMDNLGFLSLNDLSVSISISNELKVLLLIVCILAFETKVHFEKLIKDITSGRSSVVGSLCNLPLDEQLQYFKRYSMYFYISDDGYISLLPSFVCPICIFEDSSDSIKPQNNQSSVKCKISYTSPELNYKRVKDPNSVDKQAQTSGMSISNEISKSPKDTTTKGTSITDYKSSKTLQSTSVSKDSISNSSETLQSDVVSIKKVCTELFNIAEVSESVKRRLVVSILFLYENFHQLDFKRVLKTLLHVFNDIRISFISLSEMDKHDFVKACCQILNSKSVKNMQFNSTFDFEIAKEKILLFITYFLTNGKEIHVEKIANEIRKKKIAKLMSNVSEQFKFFKAIPDIITVGTSGYISLKESYYSVDSAIESYSDLIFELRFKVVHMTQHKVEECIPKEKGVTESCGMQLSTCSKKSVTDDRSKIVHNASEYVKRIENYLCELETEVENMYQRINYSILLYRRHFKDAHSSHVIKAFVLALHDVYKYFSNLSSENQHKFVEKYRDLIEQNHEINLFGNYNITALEEEFLCITYLIIKEKRLHYQKIVAILVNVDINTSLYEKTSSEQFKFFRRFDRYLKINGDGYVMLKASFDHINTIIDSVPAYEPKNLTKHVQIKKEEECSSAICGYSPSPNTVRQTFLSPEGSLKIKVRKFLRESKNTSEKEISGHCQLAKVDQGSIDSSFETGISNNLPQQNEFDSKDIIIDLCVFILSICDKMSIEKLWCRLNSTDLKGIKCYFSILNVAEKEEFFKNFPQYFFVTADGFVSLQENVANNYVPKTNVSISKLFSSGISMSGKSPDCLKRSRSEFRSSCTSEIPEVLSNSGRTKRKKPRKRRRVSKALPYNVPDPKIMLSKSQNITSVIKPIKVENESHHESENSMIYNCFSVSESQVCNNAFEAKGDLSCKSTSITSECSFVINNNAFQINSKSVLGKNNSLDHEISHSKNCSKSRTKAVSLSRVLDSKSNICDINVLKTIKQEKENFPISDTIQISLGKTNISSGNCSESKVLPDFTHEVKKTSEQVKALETNVPPFSNLSSEDVQKNPATLSQEIKFGFNFEPQEQEVNKNCIDRNEPHMNKTSSKIVQSLTNCSAVTYNSNEFSLSTECKFKLMSDVLSNKCSVTNKQSDVINCMELTEMDE